MNPAHVRCSLCSRDFPQREIRQSPVAGHGGGYLCRMCWSVMCPQPWPTEDSAHGGQHIGSGGLRPDRAAFHSAASGKASSAVQLAQAQAEAEAAAREARHRLSIQRSASMANMTSSRPGMPVPGRGGGGTLSGRHPASMPERPVILGGSADDPRWGGLGVGSNPTGSAPSWRLSLAAAPPPPTFSPVELKNMMDEESLELFESQSHLLDPESRAALERQRQYLQWQNSVEEPGPMQSVLERQDSAGSGCQLGDEGMMHGGTFAAAALAGYGVSAGNNSGGEDTSSGGTAGGSAIMVHELQETKRHLAIVSREREALSTRVQQLEAELEAQRETLLCKICRQAPRNCVLLPCLHFTSCDGCFKRHCKDSAAAECPMCSGRITGFQTLLLMS